MTKQMRIDAIKSTLESAIQILNLTNPQTPQANIILLINTIHQVRLANASLETLKDIYEREPNAT